MVPGLSLVGSHRSSGRWSIIHDNILPSILHRYEAHAVHYRMCWFNL